jgi:hypothetical protein
LKKLLKGKDKKKKEKPQWATGKADKDKNAKKNTPPPRPAFVNTTPKGEKKDLSQIPFADAYHPQAVEAAWQDWWEACGFYKGDAEDAMGKSEDEKFIMVIPPPNVTGSLHLGHALTAAVEDTLTRWHRMKGHATLYVPGKSCYSSFFPFMYGIHTHMSSGQPWALLVRSKGNRTVPDYFVIERIPAQVLVLYSLYSLACFGIVHLYFHINIYFYRYGSCRYCDAIHCGENDNEKRWFDPP